MNEIAETFGRGRLDAVVANSGVCANVPALEYDEQTWSRNNSVNYDGAMWTAQAAGKIFKKQGHGSIIFTASVSATLVNIPQTQAAYNASKAAVVHLAKSLAVEWADFARVNCISPGFILTESKNGFRNLSHCKILTRTLQCSQGNLRSSWSVYLINQKLNRADLGFAG
jgi:sorbose reductase